MSKSLLLLLLLLTINLYSCTKSSDKSIDVPAPSNVAGTPVLSDSTMISLAFVDSLSVGVNLYWIQDNGGHPITARGLVWSTSPDPTVELSSKFENGPYDGGFSTTITGLNSNTVYYIREYATNIAGTSYSNQRIFKTTIQFKDVVIGSIYGGGVVFYFLQPGDPTYDPDVRHGLVAYMGQSSDYDGQPWDASGQNILFWGLDSLIFSGGYNTTNIIYQQRFEPASPRSAASFCNAAFDDYNYPAAGILPSKQELNLLYLYAGPGAAGAHTDILKFKSIIYWSSSQYDSTQAYWQNFADGTVGYGPKSDLHAISPIRMF